MKEVQNSQGEQTAFQFKGRSILNDETGRLQQHGFTKGLRLNA
jgi:hypothetical protein